MATKVPYDEFSMFHENASEYGIPYDAPPVVTREFVTMPDGRKMSALRWGTDTPRIVFLHGGAQNAHTWDTVVMALGVSALCIDLPGHGHSDSAAPFDAAAAEIYDLYATKLNALRLAVDSAITVLRVDQIIMAKQAGGPKPRNPAGDNDD
jgi:alpha-beta hydrolase superfamily lysophospholipase